MKSWMLLPLLALAGCSQITNYQQAVKLPAPDALQGVWKTVGPQKGLVSPQATAYLMVNASGDTLDCRQWQRVIAKPGKLARIDGEIVNINRQLRAMPLSLQGTTLHYDNLNLQKVSEASVPCQRALEESQTHPAQAVLQNIPLEP